MKRIFALCLTFACASPLFAQEVWEGSTAVSAYGVFPSTGFYGASNSFPQNTLVSVQDLDTGKQAAVLIIDRTAERGLLLLLSKDAGDALGITPGTTAHVRVTLAKQPMALRGAGDLPYSPDSDIYPAAGVGNPTSLAFLDQYLAKKGTSAAPSSPKTAAGAPAGAAPQVAELAPPAVAGPAAPIAGQAIPAPAVEAPAPAAASRQVAPQTSGEPTVVALQPGATPSVNNQPPPIQKLPEPAVVVPSPQVAELSGSTPPAEAVPQLVPVTPPAPSGLAATTPAQSAPVASELPTLTPPQGTALAAVPPSAVPQVPAGSSPLVVAMVEPAPPESGAEFALQGELPTPSLVAPSTTALAATPPAGATGAPAAAEAAAAGAEAVQAPAGAAAAGGIRTESSLVADRYYVQLGVFVESGSALNMASSLSPLYPVSVYAARKGTRELYKVLVGPLNSDEGGSVLYHFIDRGYRDAFLRKVE